MMYPTHRRFTHPGTMLLEEFLKPRGISPRTAAIEMGLPVNRINDLIRGRGHITPDTARRFATFLDTTPEFWMNLEKLYTYMEGSWRVR
jgi:antitoxin HigA-1